MNGQKLSKGFTLIEMIVTLGVVAIFAMVAIPSYKSTVQNNRLTSSANELLGALYFARSEAVKRRDDVQICTSKNTHNDLSAVACDNSAAWHQGWIVWSDKDGNGSMSAAEVLKIGGEREGDIKIYASTDISTAVTFSSRGLTRMSGTWQLCDARGTSKAKSILISPSGRTRTATTDHLGGNLTCS